MRALSKHVRKGVFITLTINRDRWTHEQVRERFNRMSATEKRKAKLTADRIERLPVEELAYRILSARVSLCISRRLGFKVWVRIIEPQTTSGNGWIHWHIIAEAWGTPWCRPGGFVNLKRLAAALWATWDQECEGGRPDLQLVRSPNRLASYVSKYVTKGWPAIPPWLLECERGIRLVGFSKAAGAIVRAELGMRPQKRSDDDDRPKRKKRPPGKLLDRLSESGMSCVVIQDSRYVGVVPLPWDLLFMVHHELPELAVVGDVFKQFDGVVAKARMVLAEVFGSRDTWRDFVSRAWGAVERLGCLDHIEQRRRELKERFTNGWAVMQAA